MFFDPGASMGFATALFFLAFSTAAGASTGVMGDWLSPNKSIVRVHPCGKSVCMKIVKLSSEAHSKVDTLNPQSGLRSRSLCGLDIGTDFRQVDETHLQDGHLYDPESGHTYSGIAVAKGDKLNLRGYIGISLFGRSEVWDRVTTPQQNLCP